MLVIIINFLLHPDEKPEEKWIVFDGPVDTLWIESMNSVMDDNKILTLASNERIPLHPHMRLIFEIGHLKYATPATVSRAARRASRAAASIGCSRLVMMRLR